MTDFAERKIGALTVRIDRDACMANESCVALAGEVFALDDDRICTFADPLREIERERLLEACQTCPVQALIVVDESGDEIVP